MKVRSLCAAAACLLPVILSAQESPPPAAAPATEQQAAPAAAKKDYIRFTEDEKTGRLEIAICRFTGKDGLQVDLVGVVHIADKAYYKELDRRLGEDYDAVLYELVGEPERLQPGLRKAKDDADPVKAEAEEDAPPEKPARHSMLGTLQKKMGDILKLEFQLGSINYDRPHFIHADMTPKQFEEERKRNGESFLKMFLRSLKAQGDPEMAKMADDLNAITPGLLLKLMLNRDVSADLKIALGRMFDQSEHTTGKLFDGENGSVILDGRNKVASEKLAEIIKQGKKKISIFYGAAHLPGLEELMIRDHGLTPSDTQWLPAWTIEKPKPKAARNKAAPAEKAPDGKEPEAGEKP